MKDTNMHPIKDNYRFGVLFDGSAISIKVLEKTLSIMANGDRLTAITVVEPGINKDAVEDKVLEICSRRANFDTVVLHRRANQEIRDRIKDYLIEQSEDNMYVDFVCVGNRGLNVGNAAEGDNYLGRVAQAMIAMKRLNVIFVP